MLGSIEPTLLVKIALEMPGYLAGIGQCEVFLAVKPAFDNPRGLNTGSQGMPDTEGRQRVKGARRVASSDPTCAKARFDQLRAAGKNAGT